MADAPPAQAVIRDYLAGYRRTQAVNVAARLESVNVSVPEGVPA
jgi:hypothetical protein